MQGTVLLVDDEPNVLAGLQRALRKEPYEVLCASSVVEAFALLRAKTVDVVISDQDMPGMKGTAFLRKACKEFPDTVRFILTGKATKDVILQAIKDGAISRFFVKPCDYVDLAAAIRQILHQKDAVVVAKRFLETVKPRSVGLEQLERPSLYVQIDSPRRISAQLLQPFQTQTKNVLLVDIQKKKILLATIQSIHDTYFIADTQHSTLFYKRGKRLLVVFPALPQQHYILPAWIDKTYHGRFKMRYLDPHHSPL